MRRDRLVGGQHELFNDAMRDVARRSRNAGHRAPLIEFDQRLGKIEIDGASPDAFAIENHGEFAHQLEAIHQSAVARALRGISFQQQMDIRIGHTFHTADRAAAKLFRQQIALPVEFHQSRKRQTVHMRFERAYIRRKLVGQHGHGAVGKIDARPAQPRFGVHGSAGPHIVADIGDVHMQREMSVRQLVDPDSVVKVPRRFAIDGDDRHLAEIPAPLELDSGNHGRDVLCLLDRLGWEMVREMMLANDDFDVDPEIVRAAQDLDHPPYRVFAALRVLQQFHVYDHSVERRALRDRQRLGSDAVNLCGGSGNREVVRNLDPILQPRVVRDNELSTAGDAEFSYHGRVRALQDLDHFAIGATAPLNPRDPDQRAIPVHRAESRVRWKVDVAGYPLNRPVWNEEPVTVFVHADAAGGVFPVVRGRGIMTRAKLDQIASRDQPTERRLQNFASGVRLADQLFEVGLGMRQPGNMLQERRVGHFFMMAEDRILNSNLGYANGDRL